MRLASIAVFAVLAIAASTVPTDRGMAQDSARRLPGWMSIGAGRALMRTGPARTYPGAWLYQRADLPVKIVGEFKEWRRVQDPDGTEGWMLVNLLRKTRTAYVRGPPPRRCATGRRRGRAWRGGRRPAWSGGSASAARAGAGST